MSYVIIVNKSIKQLFQKYALHYHATKLKLVDTMFSIPNYLMQASFKCLQAESMKCEVSGVQRKEMKETQKREKRKFKTAKLLIRNYWSCLLFGECFVVVELTDLN